MTIKYEDIKEIFLQYDLFIGGIIVVNLEKKINQNSRDYINYLALLKKEKNTNTFFIIGMSKQDLKKVFKIE
jgi:hypothetical protein